MHRQTTIRGYEGLELHVQEWTPSGEARAGLTIVHGFGEHGGRYGNVVDWFVPRDYVVRVLDLRGHGRSPGRRGHINRWGELIEDVQAFVRWSASETPDVPMFLLGHSLGGLIAIDIACHHPHDLAGVIASGPSLGALPVSSLLLVLARLMSRIWPTFTQDVHLDETALSRDASVGEAYASDPLVHNLSSARMGMEILGSIQRIRDQAGLLNVPCLIVHGGADRISTPADCLEFYNKLTVADKTWHEYDDYYHEVFNDIGKERVLADVEAWIERHLTAS